MSLAVATCHHDISISWDLRRLEYRWQRSLHFLSNWDVSSTCNLEINTMNCSEFIWTHISFFIREHFVFNNYFLTFHQEYYHIQRHVLQSGCSWVHAKIPYNFNAYKFWWAIGSACSAEHASGNSCLYTWFK